MPKRGIDDVLAMVAQPVALLGPSGQVLHFNEQFAKAVGYSTDQLKGFAFTRLLDAQGKTDFACYFRTGAATQLTVSICTACGDTVIAQLDRFKDGDQPTGHLVIIPGPSSQVDPRLRYVMEHLDLGVWDYDVQTSVFTVSKAWREIRGWSADAAVDVSNDAWLENIHPDDRKPLSAMFAGQTEGMAQSISIQYRHRHSDGHWIWILCRASVMEADAQGRPVKIVGTDTDLTHVKAHENDLRELTNTLQLAIAASGMGIWEFDPATSQVHWDDRMLEIYGIADGKNLRHENLWETYIHPDDLSGTVAYSEECKRQKTDFNRDYRIVRPNGEVRHIRSLARNVAAPNTHGKLIGVNIDVSDDYFRTQELELARNQLEHDSRHDALTGLGNRRKSNEETQALFRVIGPDDCYAVLQLDLDHFKRVNDMLGHAAGDYVLRRVAKILKTVIGDLGTAFRTGGDEFTILLKSAPPEKVLKKVCEEIIKGIGTPATFEGEDCTVGVSIGYATGKGVPKKPSQTFIKADNALYAAKHAGRSTYLRYSAARDMQRGPYRTSRQDIIEAMRKRELICHFQPQFDADTLEIVGAEALVRWQCPKRGLLLPEQFLSQAVQSEVVAEIDGYVLHYVLEQQDRWSAEGVNYPRISVNVSKARLQANDLAAQIKTIIMPHHKINFELLETAFLDHIDTRLAFTFDALRDLGIRFQLDDFGTGHSSVAALKAVKPEGVKIDRSLFPTPETNPGQLRSLSRIARLEGAEVVIVGLETGIQLAACRDIDCDALQGWALQRPIATAEFGALLAAAANLKNTKVIQCDGSQITGKA
jgi:diguanylate cyclase (GGDEF)-like protein/PAS domain S-box-containing protein